MEPMGTMIPHVLVVDDEPAQRMLVSTVLESVGMQVTQVESGEEAVRVFTEVAPDCVVLDVMLAGIDGFETCMRIRRFESGLDVPVLMLTGLEDAGAVGRSYDAGATDFCDKRIDPLQLAYRVQHLVRAHRVSLALRASTARLEAVQQLARLGWWEWMPEGAGVAVSGMAGALLGTGEQPPSFADFCARVPADELERVREAIAHGVELTGEFSLSHRILDPEGRERFVQHRGLVKQTGTTRTVMSTLHDLTEQHEIQRRVEFLANFDTVTGLPNRRRLADLGQKLLDGLPPTQRKAALVVVHVDGVQPFTETWGVDAGEALQREIAHRLTELPLLDVLDATSIRVAPPLLARVDAEHFALLVPGLSEADEIGEIAHLMQQAFVKSFDIAAEPVLLPARTGAASWPEDAEHVDGLVMAAITAARAAREDATVHVRYFGSSMRARLTRRFSIEAGLRRALEDDSIEVLYQPRVRLRDGITIGVEALARWRSASLGVVQPSEFIPVAERVGLISELDRLVLDRACRDMQRLRDRERIEIALSVNVSPVQLREGDVARRIDAVLAASDLPPFRLEVEMTEGAFMRDPELVGGTLQRLRDRGVRVALDDFGTGYSSLAYLSRFPVDAIKIDRSFVTRAVDDENAGRLLKGMLALARSLELTAIAEGVETPQQLRFLRENHCDEVQGFLLGAAMPIDELAATLRAAAERRERESMVGTSLPSRLPGARSRRS